MRSGSWKTNPKQRSHENARDPNPPKRAASFGLLDQCVRSGITAEEFKELVLPEVPERLASILRTGTLDATQLAELSKHLRKPEITARLGTPEMHAYLDELLRALSADSTAQA